MSKFLDLINKQRTEKKEERFKGTFLEYLEKLQEDSDIAKPAHKRLYDAIKPVSYTHLTLPTSSWV